MNIHGDRIEEDHWSMCVCWCWIGYCRERLFNCGIGGGERKIKCGAGAAGWIWKGDLDSGVGEAGPGTATRSGKPRWRHLMLSCVRLPLLCRRRKVWSEEGSVWEASRKEVPSDGCGVLGYERSTRAKCSKKWGRGARISWSSVLKEELGCCTN